MSIVYINRKPTSHSIRWIITKYRFYPKGEINNPTIKKNTIRGDKEYLHGVQE